MQSVSQKDEAFRSFALTGHPMKVLLTACLPLALFQALQTVFRLLDSLMASHIGSEAVSAVAALSQITLMITALGAGLAVGGSIKISEAYGQGDYETVRIRVSTVYGLAVAASLAVAVVLIPFAQHFLRLLQTPEALIAAGTGYFRIEVLTLVISFFNTTYLAIERSRGHARKILALNLANALVKLSLSALFVYVLEGGLIHLALATLAGQCLILGYALFSMSKDEGAFRFSPKYIRMNRATLLPMLNLAYPVSAENMLFAGGKVVVNAMSGVYGPLTVGALGISNNLGGLINAWHGGLTEGAAPLISQNRGAGKHSRTLKLYYSLLAVDIAIGLIGYMVIPSALPKLAELFAHSQGSIDPGFRDMIIAIHRWEMLAYVTLGIHSATTALLLGYGYTKLTLLVNVTRVFVYRVPVLWAFQQFTRLGVEAVGLTMMISNVCTGLTAIAVSLPVIRRIKKLAAEEQA